MSDQDPRTRILDEALRLFAHNGYGSTSVREVAEAAGFAKPTLYYHFGSKEGLFRAVVQSRLDHMTQLVNAAISAPGPAVERLRAFVSAYLLGALEDVDAVRLMMTCSMPAAEGQPDIDVVARHLRNIAPLTAVIEQGVAAGELRHGLQPRVAVIALIGAVNLHLVSALNGTHVDQATVDAVLETWLSGVST